MALGSIVFGGSRQWRWLRALMGSATTVRMAAFMLLALAMPVANAAPCSLTWNVTNDGRMGHYAHTFSAGERAACLMGDGAYTSPAGDVADMPAEGGGFKGVEWQQPPYDTLHYTPPSPAFTGTNNVIWYNLAGEPITVTINMTGAIPAPIVTAISPSFGPMSGGNNVTITGTNLGGATAVRFGAAAAMILDNTATSITARVPSSPPGTVQVTVTTPGGTSATVGGNQYTYIPPPTISSVAPASGPTAGGTSVTINGTGFTGATAVLFGGTAAGAVTVVSDSVITAVSPAGSPGVVDVMVLAPGGNSVTSASDQFTYTAPAPAVSSVFPGSGPTAGGTSVTIGGSNFLSANAVRFGATNAASFSVISANTIIATSPAGSTGTVDITVSNPGGTSATTASDQFTYLAAPDVSGVAPNSGPAAGGTTVTIIGSGFIGATSVSFGGTSASSFTVNSATSITATSPAHAAGTVDVRVVTSGGASATSAADQFTYVSPPVANPTSLTVAFQSSNNPVTLSLSGGAATSVAVATQAAHGTATAVGTTITFTPNPSFAGTDSFSYTATNASGTSAPATVSITVVNPTIAYSPTAAPPGNAGQAYSHSLAGASGGAAPYTYSLLYGSLPAGLTLASNGTLSGTPTEAGVFSFRVHAQDSTTGNGPFGADSALLAIVISPPTLTLSPANGSTFNGNVGTAFSQSFTVSGGVAPYQYMLAVTGGIMPSGLSFNSATGTLSGTPTSAGSVTFQITGSDSTGGNGSMPVWQTYTLTVAAPTLGLSPATLPNAVVDTAYSQTMSTSGGSSPYSYAVTTGALPSGLTLSPAGTLSGTPSAAGSFTFTITSTDSHGFTTSRSFNVVTNPAAPLAGPVGKIVPWNTATAIDLATAISGGAASSVAVTTTPAHGSVTISGTVATYTPAPGYSGGDSFGYSATNVSGSSASLVTLMISPQVPVAGAKSVTVAFNTATPIDLASVISGGTPTGMAVSTAPAHGTVTVSGTTITYTPGASYSGTDSFSYTATNAGGTSAPAVVSLTVNPQVPVAGAKSVTIAFNAATPIDLASVISGGTPTGLTVSTQPAHGAVTVSGTTITYTPSAGYSGTDSFSYTATNAGGTSAAAVVSLTVNPQVPVAGTKSVTVAFNAATPIDLASVISGGTPTTLAVSTQPAHGTVTVSGTTITYTPSAGYSGTDSFSYTATNAGGTSAPAAVSVTVNPQLPMAGAKSVTVAFDAATPIDLASVITGGTPTGLAVSTQPAHGAVTVSGTTITYTPSAGYSGTDSFGYTASNAGGTSAAAVVSLTINPQVPVANNIATTFTTGNNNRFTIAFDISGGAATGVTIVTQPAHGTVTVNAPAASANSGGMQPAAVSTTGFSAIYVPDAGYVGTDSFTYTATNAGGSSAPATVSLQLNPPAPTVAPLSVTTVSGSPITIDVAARASGGPFTALAIDSQPAEGKTVLQGLGIVYTPTPAFVGTATIAYSLSNAYGTTQGTVTVTVTARLDPSRDPEVNGLVAAQADAARRFATTQLGNFNRRLERLHGNGWAGSNASLDVSAYGVGMTLTPSGVQPNDLRNTRSEDDTAQGSPIANETDRAAATRPARDAAATDARQNRIGYWIDGRIDLGQRDATTNQSDFDFRTDGISLGADYRLNDLASLGVGAGYARDESDVGNNGSRSTGTAGMVAIYGSLRPAQKWFVDGVLGYGALDFDLDRYVTDTGDLAQGSRQGDQVFGSLATGYERREDTWMVSPYGRLDAMTTRLDTYTESANGVSALHYNEQTVRMTTGTLGVRGEMLFNTRLGNVVPRGRFEYRRHFEGADNASVFYADLVGVGPGYLISPAQMEKNQFVIGLGGTLILRGNVALSLDFDSTLNNDTGRSQSIGARVDMPF